MGCLIKKPKNSNKITAIIENSNKLEKRNSENYDKSPISENDIINNNGKIHVEKNSIEETKKKNSSTIHLDPNSDYKKKK